MTSFLSMHITPCMDRRCIVTVRDELKIALVDSDWWSHGIKHTCSQTKILVRLTSHLCLVNYADMSLSAQCLIEKKYDSGCLDWLRLTGGFQILFKAKLYCKY